MKRILFLAAVLILAAGAVPAQAHDDHHAPGEKVVTKSVTGEIVDLGCYLGHAARGEKHESCAARCVNQGMPMGLLTANETLYLVTFDHDNADPYNGLKAMAGKTVTITGELMSRSGMKAIEASSFVPAGK